jgi:hypothetical protein
MGTVAEINEPKTVLTLEEFWKAFLKSQEDFDRRTQEADRRAEATDRRAQESRENFDRQMQKSREDFDRQTQKSRDNFDRQTQKSREDFDRQMQKSREDFDRRMQETDRQIRLTHQELGKLGKKFGSTIEHLVAPNLVEKFRALNFNVTRYCPNMSITDKANNIAAEVDIFIENGDCAIAVEVKAQLKIDDVKEHVERMEILRRDANLRHDVRKFYGAVAGAIINDNVKEYAFKTGFFVIAQSGDTMRIDVPEGFKPRVW